MPDLKETVTAGPATAERKAGTGGESRGSVIAAILGNILVGIVKFVAAAISGSTAMLSEGIHSIVDSGNGILILLGLKRAERKPDFTHPFGYGKELYFWTLVVSLLIFALGGLVSIVEGSRAIAAADVAKISGDARMSYIVLVLAALIEGGSLYVGLRTFNRARGDMRPFEFIRQAKDPSLYTVVLEDSAAELGLIFAFCGVFLGRVLHNPYLDGAASVLIGTLLCVVAVILLKETKGLLVGEGMPRTDLEEVRDMVEDDPAVETCGRILTMYVGPNNLLLATDAGFRQGVSAQEILDAIDRIEASIIARFPETDRIFIESESLKRVRESREAIKALEES